MLTNGVLRCDMNPECAATVTHIDTKGFVYCAAHGAQRKAGGYQCRKLTAPETAALTRGETIAYSKPKGAKSAKSAAKAVDALASRICSAATSGAQIPLLGITALHRAAHAVLLAGGTEEAARAAADAWVAANRTDKPASATAALGLSAVARLSHEIDKGIAAQDTARAQVAAYYAPPAFPLRYRTHMIERDGTEWTSSEAFDAPHERAVAQACIAGHLKGTSYWCTEEGTGRFLNGIGKDGGWITSSPLSLSDVAPAAYDALGRAMYFPAVRIYNPHQRLTYRRIRGSAHTLVAYDTRDASLGPEPVGWVLGEDVPAGSVVS